MNLYPIQDRMLMVSVGRTCQGHFITSSSSFLPKTAEECSPKMNNIAGKALSPSENTHLAIKPYDLVCVFLLEFFPVVTVFWSFL